MTEEQRKPDQAFMRLALELARDCRPSPNPRVGAVIVRDGQVVGRGRHERAGEPHAEVLALEEAGEAARGAELYVTLEPCCHQGRTPPCTKTIASAGLTRVVVGMIDPDPLVSGRGIECLKHSGHQVDLGMLESDCRQMLEGYATHRLLGRPLITLKAAVTLDGAIATTSGDSKWISSELSRVRAHAMRAEADAVLVGSRTVLADDPELTVRHVEGDNPVRVVLDSALRTPADSKLVRTANQAPLLLVHAGAPTEAVARFESFPGVETLRCDPTPDGRVDLKDLAGALGERGVLSLLVEGGGQVHGALIEAGLADRFELFVAPKLLGGGLPWVSLTARASMDEAIRVEGLTASAIGDDLLLSGRFTPPPWESRER
ncbi:MAG: bifunctional diaminohydroxyphosphoribosylaminopyrimidine deaminase/5-amino-6-(5-phosphoribosylamino)uracil reductase RibD [Deltaproteobacteria bacterium]|nr:bifunctional diaminohydroxyphosphoribosylaminopyrimidine deaminase/5-amino-6-(5-phosphoribosylamino)uracil reductase RibD [Deltaproteobacteria bacterium]